MTQEPSLSHKGWGRCGHGVSHRAHHAHDPVDGGVTQEIPGPPDGLRPK